MKSDLGRAIRVAPAVPAPRSADTAHGEVRLARHTYGHNHPCRHTRKTSTVTWNTHAYTHMCSLSLSPHPVCSSYYDCVSPYPSPSLPVLLRRQKGDPAVLALVPLASMLAGGRVSHFLRLLAHANKSVLIRRDSCPRPAGARARHAKKCVSARTARNAFGPWVFHRCRACIRAALKQFSASACVASQSPVGPNETGGKAHPPRTKDPVP